MMVTGKLPMSGAVAALAVAVGLASCDGQGLQGFSRESGSASASSSPSGSKDGTLFTIDNTGTSPGWTDNYDYAASIIQEGNTRHIWWCGYEVYLTDVIYYRTQNVTTGQYSPVQRVFAPTAGSGLWDDQFVCDPSVIRGQFVNPDNQTTYSYAMYYTATEVQYANVGENRIGIAFSNDGVNWVRYSGNPIISPAVYPSNTYGAGQASTYNSNGQAGIWLFYTDFTPSGESLYMRTTTDGINFGPATPISTDGVLPGQNVRTGNPDIAYDYVGQQWYAVFTYAYDSGNPRPLRSGGVDRERYFFGLYRMPASEFPSGTWEHLGFVSTNSTGHVTNNNPALVRDGFGNVNATLPNIETIFAGGTSADTWELYSATWNDASPRVELKRYYSPFVGTHWVTSGVVTSGYGFEQSLGYLYRGRRVAGTEPLYGCRGGTTDYFLSLDAGCEGQYPLGVNGYIYSSPPSQPHYALYRCYTGAGHFVSLASNCEGQTTESLLGYSLINPS